MASLSNVSISATFYEWVTRLNQLVVKTNDMEVQTTGAFSRANTANTTAFFAAPRANIAFSQANQAFSQANTGTEYSQGAYLRANIAFSQANQAFSQANTGATWSVAAFGAANTGKTWAAAAYAAANTAVSSSPAVSSSFDKANAAFAQANTKITANNAESLSEFTTDDWGIVQKLDQGKAIQWTKSGTTHAFGLGFTSNNGLHVFTSSLEDNTGSPNYFFRVSPNTILFRSGTVWHEGNDGSGSGLDADLLDGKHASSFVLGTEYTASDVLTKIKTVDGTSSGLDADLLDGADSSESATASTIAKRNSSGHLLATYFNSTDASVGSGLTAVMCKVGSDNYIRSATKGGLAAFLSGQSMNISGTATNITQYTINQSVGTGNAVQHQSLGIGVAASGSSGDLRATGNITAYYSDIRLKMQITPIESALDKVKQLSGFTYRPNETAKKFGYTDDSVHVGLSAQEVQKVLPEAVKLAPFDSDWIDGKEYSKSGENYLTVQYERVVPLLLEAIKELEEKVERLSK